MDINKTYCIYSKSILTTFQSYYIKFLFIIFGSEHIQNAEDLVP